MTDELKPSVSNPAPTPPVVVSKPADPLGKPNDPVKDNTAQGLDTKKHDAISKESQDAHVDETTTSKDILKRIQTILLEYDNKETDIPITHGYWNLLNQYRRLRSLE